MWSSRGVIICFICIFFLACNSGIEPEEGLVITSVTPDKGNPGTAVEIRGRYFGSDPSDITIDFNRVLAPVVEASDTLLKTEVPELAEEGPITVTVGEKSVATGFDVFTDGVLEVIVSTGGSFQDPTGYQVIVIHEQEKKAVVNDILYFRLEQGHYNVELRDVSPSCTLSDDTRSFDISAPDTTTVAFDLTCEAPVLENKIIFFRELEQRFVDQSESGVYVMNPDGTNQIKFLSAGFSPPKISPNGNKFLFNRVNDEWGIYIMNPDGSGLQKILNIEEYQKVGTAFWKPDGSKILFHMKDNSNYNIYTINPDGSSLTRLTTASSGEFSPSWSPDGSRITFWSDRNDEEGYEGEIFVMNADGTNVQRIVKNTGEDYFADISGPVLWSTDGTEILFVGMYSQSNIYSVNTDGTELTKLTDWEDSIGIREFYWSPDSQWIVFSGDNGGQYDLYQINRDGTGQVQLTTHEFHDVNAVWNPPH